VLGEHGGIGLVLGALGDGWWLLGVDLDRCIAENGLEAAGWARQVTMRLFSYTEVSPSGTGAHVICRCRAEDVEAVTALLDGKSSKKWVDPRWGTEHPPGIQLHLGGYYTFTGERVSNSPENIRVISLHTLLWLIGEAGPTYLRSVGDAEAWNDTENRQEAAREAIATCIERVHEAIPGTRNDVLNKEGYTVGGLLAIAGMSKDEAVDALVEALRGDDPRKDRDTARRAVNDGAKKPITPRRMGKNKGAAALAAAIKLMRTRDEWQSVFAYNEFAVRIVVRRALPVDRRGELPRLLRDVDITDVTEWLQNHGVRISSSATIEAIHSVACHISFHPVRDYLHALNWDQVPRLDTWLIDYLGARDTRLNRAFGARWMIGAVARIETPGCPMKNVLSIQGIQDIGKSSALAALAVRPEWFLDHIPDLRDKDVYMVTSGKWIIEFAEFDRLGKVEASRVKAFISTRIDTFRAPWGRVAEDHPRQWVGAITINPGAEGHLPDDTGNVRFWTVACAVGWEPTRHFDTTALAATRDQLWAEAMHRFRVGEHWWLHEKEMQQEQARVAAEHVRTDPREPLIAGYLEKKQWVVMHKLLEDALGVMPNAPNYQTVATQAGKIITILGWVRHKLRHGPGGSGRYYFPPGTTDPGAYAARIFGQEKLPL
jgi:predicted P-loop ATPase